MNNGLVIDSSFLMSQILPDEQSKELDLSAYDLYVPALFYLECMSVLDVA